MEMFHRPGSRFPTSFPCDFIGLGSFYHLAAVFVGSAEPVNGSGVNGSDGLSPCVSGENCASMAIPAGKL